MYNALIVDDEPLMLRYIRNNLNLIDKSWAAAATASDGLQAVDILKEQGFDLVITDIHMPEMDGLALAKHIHDNYPDTKVIIVTGYDEFEYAREAVRCGVYDYLLKPVSDEAFAGVLSSVAEKIKEDRSKRLALQTILKMPANTANEIAADFLHALITENQATIRALYPIVYDMKLKLIKGSALVLLLMVNEAEALLKGHSPAELPVFRMILREYAASFVQHMPYVHQCCDADGNVVVHLTDETPARLERQCVSFYEALSKNFKEETGLTLMGACGEPVEDNLQLAESYQAAVKAMPLNMFGYSSPITIKQPLNERQFLNRFHSEAATIAEYVSLCRQEELLIVLSRYAVLIEPPADCSNAVHAAVALSDYLSKMGSNNNVRETAFLKINAFLENCPAEKEVSLQGLLALFQQIALIYMQGLPLPEDEDIGLLAGKAKEFICLHYNEPISLALIAERLGVSSSYLSDIFHKSVGEPYSKYLTRIRMEQAAKLLKNSPEEKVYAIAEQVGFISVKHFNSVFKKYYAVTPKEYQDSLGQS